MFLWGMTCLNRSTRNKLGSYLLTYFPQFHRFMNKTDLECCIAQLHSTAVRFSPSIYRLAYFKIYSSTGKS